MERSASVDMASLVAYDAPAFASSSKRTLDADAERPISVPLPKKSRYAKWQTDGPLRRSSRHSKTESESAPSPPAISLSQRSETESVAAASEASDTASEPNSMDYAMSEAHPPRQRWFFQDPEEERLPPRFRRRVRPTARSANITSR